MENNNKFKTYFLTPFDIKNYMSILGAIVIVDDAFILDGLLCCVDKNNSIRFENKFSSSIIEKFKECGLSGSIDEESIYDLDGLVLLHTILCGENVEECYDINLYQAKRDMLNSILVGKDIGDFNGSISDFDKAVAPFLKDNFDSSIFINQCFFSTTGYYSKDGYDKCLKFVWGKKSESDILYSITIDKNGYWNTIGYKKNNIELYHFVSENQDRVSFYYGDNIHIDFDYKTSEIREKYGDEVQMRRATDFDKTKMLTILNSFYDRELSFEKSNSNFLTIMK